MSYIGVRKESRPIAETCKEMNEPTVSLRLPQTCSSSTGMIKERNRVVVLEFINVYLYLCRLDDPQATGQLEFTAQPPSAAGL